MLTLFCQYFLRFWWWFLSKKTATKTRKCTFYQNAWTFCCSTLFIMFHCAQQRFLANKSQPWVPNGLTKKASCKYKKLFQ